MNDDTNSGATPFVLNDKAYKLVKWVLVLILPAVGTLYFALAQIWSLPSGQQVLGTILAVQAFLGVLLGISTSSYNNSDARFDGKIVTHEADGKTIASIESDLHPEDMLKKDVVTLKVAPKQPVAP